MKLEQNIMKMFLVVFLIIFYNKKLNKNKS